MVDEQIGLDTHHQKMLQQLESTHQESDQYLNQNSRYMMTFSNVVY